MTGKFSRRRLLGGIIGGLAVWLTGKGLPSQAAQATQPAQLPASTEPRKALPPPQGFDDGCSWTTFTYDAEGRILSITKSP
jgi:hypothetical protein